MHCGICSNLAWLTITAVSNIKITKFIKLAEFFSSLALKLDAANSTMFAKQAELIHPHTLKLDASNLTVFVKLAELLHQL